MKNISYICGKIYYCMANQILKNPFVIVGSIPADCFCDRREESARIVRTLTNEGNLLLISARNGKIGIGEILFRFA